MRIRRLAGLAVSAAAAALSVGLVAPPVGAAAGGPVTTSAINNPTTFADNFDNGRLDGWQVRTLATAGGPAQWRVVGGRLVQASNVYGGTATTTAPDRPGTMLAAGDQAWTNYDFRVRARTADDDAFGIVFRYQGPDDFYRFSMDRQRHVRQLVRRLHGRYTLLAQDRVTYAANTWYSLRVVAVGSRLRIAVNGRAVFDVTDGTLTHGRIGMYTWGCPTTFDDVTAAVENDDFFTVAVVPDTQYEAAGRPAELAAQTSWLSAHRATLHLADVLQEGDVVDNMRSATQWSTAAQYFRYLDGKTPYAIAAGNHDVFDMTGHVAPFPVYSAPFDAFVAKLPDYRVNGRFQTDSFLNTYQLVDAGGVHLLVLNLQFGARDDVLAWAGQVADRYPDRHAILLTHDYLGANGLVRGPDVAGGTNALPTQYNPSLNDPTAIWTKFVKTHPNVQFTLNGHVIDPTSPTEPWSTARLVSTNDAGRPVYQTLTNYQTYGGTGLGYLRLFRFYPAEGRVTVTTFSPAQNTYLTDPDDQFSFEDVDLGRWPPAP